MRQMMNWTPTKVGLNYLPPSRVTTSIRPNKIYNSATTTGIHGYCRISQNNG